MDDKDVQKRIALFLEASDKMKKDRALDSEEHAKNVESKKKLFQQVVSELGLSLEEQKELEEIGINFLNIAQDFYFKSDLEQAIAFAEKSAQLLPYDVRPLELLLTIHLKGQDNASQENAKKYAAEILKLQPSHQNALVVLHKKKQVPTQTQSQGSSPLPTIVITMVALMLIGGITLGALVFFVLSSEEPAPVIEEPAVVDADPIKNPLDFAKEAEKEVLATIQNTVDSQLPVDFVNSLAGVEFADRGSEFNFYNTSFSYQLKMVLKNQGTEELGEITALIELIDANDNVVVKKSATLYDDYEPVIRPGETASMDHLIYEEIIDPSKYRHPQKVRIQFGKMKHTPAPKSISKEDVKIVWEGGKPEQFALKIQRRKSAENYGSYNSLMNNYHTKNIYEITNTGAGVIKKLKLREERLGEDGSVLDADEGLVTYSSEAYIAPNETRTDIFFGDSNKKIAGLRVTVVEIE